MYCSGSKGERIQFGHDVVLSKRKEKRVLYVLSKRKEKRVLYVCVSSCDVMQVDAI